MTLFWIIVIFYLWLLNSSLNKKAEQKASLARSVEKWEKQKEEREERRKHMYDNMKPFSEYLAEAEAKNRRKRI